MSFDWLSSASEIGVDTETKDPHLRYKRDRDVFVRYGTVSWFVVVVVDERKERRST